MEERTTCCICFLTEDLAEDTAEDSSTYWICAVCGTRCHMACITNWAQSNHNRYRSTYSCPVCRQCFDLSSLPTVQIPIHIPPPHPDPPRPSLSSFIATVLQSTRESASAHVQRPNPQQAELQETGEETVTQRSSRRRAPVVVINGTGAVHIERLTVVNHF